MDKKKKQIDFASIPDDVFRNGNWINYFGEESQQNLIDEKLLGDVFELYQKNITKTIKDLKRENVSDNLLKYLENENSTNKAVNDYLKALKGGEERLNMQKDNLQYALEGYSKATRTISLANAIRLKSVELFGTQMRNVQIRQIEKKIRGINRNIKRELKKYRKLKKKYTRISARELASMNRRNLKKNMPVVESISYTCFSQGILMKCKLDDIKYLVEQTKLYEKQILDLQIETNRRRAYIQANLDVFKNKPFKDGILYNEQVLLDNNSIERDNNKEINENKEEIENMESGTLGIDSLKIYERYKKANPNLFISEKELSYVPPEKLEYVLEITSHLKNKEYCIENLSKLSKQQLKDIIDNMENIKTGELKNISYIMAEPRNLKSDISFLQANKMYRKILNNSEVVDTMTFPQAVALFSERERNKEFNLSNKEAISLKVEQIYLMSDIAEIVGNKNMLDLNKLKELEIERLRDLKTECLENDSDTRELLKKYEVLQIVSSETKISTVDKAETLQEGQSLYEDIEDYEDLVIDNYENIDTYEDIDSYEDIDIYKNIPDVKPDEKIITFDDAYESLRFNLGEGGEPLKINNQEDKTFFVQKNYMGELEVTQKGSPELLTKEEMQREIGTELINLYKEQFKHQKIAFVEMGKDVQIEHKAEVEEVGNGSETGIEPRQSVDVDIESPEINGNVIMSFSEKIQSVKSIYNEEVISNIYDNLETEIKTSGGGIEFNINDKMYKIEKQDGEVVPMKYNEERGKYETITKNQMKQEMGKDVDGMKQRFREEKMIETREEIVI